MKKLLIVLSMLAFLAACGGSNETSSGSSSSNPASPPVSVSYHPVQFPSYVNDYNDFVAKVKKGNFLDNSQILNSYFYNEMAITVSEFNRVGVVDETEFLWMDWNSYSIEDRATGVTTQRTETKDKKIAHEYGTSHTAILTKLVGILNNKKEAYPLMNGTGYSIVTKDKKQYIIDLGRHLIENPTYSFDENARKGTTIYTLY